MPLHVFRPLTQGSYECTFVRRNQITFGNTTDDYAIMINNMFLNSLIHDPFNIKTSSKYPMAATFEYCTFGKLKVKISHLTPICINTIGTTATDLAQFQITPYLIGGIFDSGQFGKINVHSSYSYAEFLQNNVVKTRNPQGQDVFRANKCFTLSTGQIYEYERNIPNPPGRFYYSTPTVFSDTSVHILPMDIYNGNPIEGKHITPFVSKKLYNSFPQTEKVPIIAFALQWYDVLNQSTNKPRLQASAIIETELQMTFYTNDDSLNFVASNATSKPYIISWKNLQTISATDQIRPPNFYRRA